jgi:hypothetical protein
MKTTKVSVQLMFVDTRKRDFWNTSQTFYCSYGHVTVKPEIYPVIVSEVMLTYLPAKRLSCYLSVMYVTLMCKYPNPFCLLGTPTAPLITVLHFTYTNILELHNLQYFYHFMSSCTLFTIRSKFPSSCLAMHFPALLQCRNDLSAVHVPRLRNTSLRYIAIQR